MNNSWVKEFPGAVTVCDVAGVILEMNDAAIKSFNDQGGEELIGKNLLDCHPDEARAKLKELMNAQRANVYTIEKHGVKKLIYQTPWYKNGVYSGFVEVQIEIPDPMPHFVRS